MAEIITGDTTKGIKSVGELALRISKFDSYRLFTLYENIRERKLMDVSGDQKYYLVFKSPKKEIRIPEYDPKGFFEVDKVNGCVLFKITKKNAEDILSMKTSGEKIFHIVRVFEERDSFGRVLNVTDEVEVYNGRWGDDAAFNTFTTENKVDLLTKALAAQVDKNTTLLNEYNDLLEKFNLESQKTSDLEKENEALRAERDELQTLLNEYTGDTHDGIVLSTDTKYIALESSLENVGFTEEQYKNAMDELLSKGSVDLSDSIKNEAEMKLNVKVPNKGTNSRLEKLKINTKKNGSNLGDASYGSGNEKDMYVTIGNDDIFIFNIESKKDENGKDIFTDKNSVLVKLLFSPEKGFKGSVTIDGGVDISKETKKIIKVPGIITASVSFDDKNGNLIDVSSFDSIGTLYCSIIS
jgi:hypothetical protein